MDGIEGRSVSNQQRFVEQGIFVVEGAIPSAALRWADQAVESYLRRQLEGEPAPGVGFAEGEGGRFVTGLDRAIPHLGAVALYLMGLPAVLEAARAACGEEVVCTHDWLVVKNAGDGQRVEWHQDFVHDGRFPAINVGIQLDEAREDAVRFVPGARCGAEDVCAVRDRFGENYDSPELMRAPVAAGGFTVHDVLLVHGSPPLQRQRWRRTLYLEFRPLSMLDGHAMFSPERVALRRRLLDAAEEVVARLGESPSGEATELLEAEERALIDELVSLPRAIEPANYCFR